MAYASNTSRKIPAGTPNISTYGSQADGRTYYPGSGTGVMKFFTDIASSSNLEILEMYLPSGQLSYLYDDYITALPAQSGPRLIRPAGTPGESSWQGHNGTSSVGVGFSTVKTDNLYSGIYIDRVGIYIYDLIIDAPSLKRCVHINTLTTVGEIGIVGNILRRTGGKPTTISHGAVGSLGPNLVLRLVNNIVDGFYEGYRGDCAENSVIYNNTFVNLISRPMYWGSGSGLSHYARCYNNLDYNCGAASIYKTGYYGANVTLNSSTDFADYANQNYHLSETASEARGTGSDLSASTYYAFADDIDNQERSAWDAGADKYSVFIAYADLQIARNITGYTLLDIARSITGYTELEIARNVGDVFTNVDLDIARNIEGYVELEISRNIQGYVELEISRHIYGSVLGFSNFTEYFKNNIFNAVFGITPYTMPSLYLGLSTTDPLEDGSGITEPSLNNYTRVLVSSWNIPSEGIISNDAAVRTNRASGPWGDVGYIFWADSLTGGNVLAIGRLFSTISVTGTEISGQSIVFQSGSLKLSITDNIFYSFANSILTALSNQSSVPTGNITYGLSLDEPDPDGTFTEVSAIGYSRVTNNDILYAYNVYTNESSIDFPVVQSGHDWGTVTNYVIFVGDNEFAYGSLAYETINYSLYGVIGHKMPANSIVIEVE